MENPVKIDDLEVPVFLETHIYLRKFPTKSTQIRKAMPKISSLTLKVSYQLISLIPKMWDLWEKVAYP